MISFAVDGVVLDIEGTVSPVDFVYQRMFPYVRSEIDSFLRDRLRDPHVWSICQSVAREAGFALPERIAEPGRSRDDAIPLVRSEILRLMDDDSKSTGLKELQGLIWRRGFETGVLVAELFPDVAPRLRQWLTAGHKIYVYSSGSIIAQRLFFGHTTEGDLRGLIAGYFDTTIGPKKDAESYSRIAAACRIDPQELLFLSDTVAELAAAKSAGFQVALAMRQGNATQPGIAEFPQFASFDQITIAR